MTVGITWRTTSLILVVMTGACGPRAFEPPDVRRAMGHPTGDSSTLWIVADSQLHNAAGAPTRSKAALTEMFSPSALRPPSLDLWADLALANAMERSQSSSPAPVFFLGDAANVSCIGEFARFLDVMKPYPWLGVLGNHDGYYMGNMTFRPDGRIDPKPETWQGACQYSLPRADARLLDLERAFIEDIDGRGGLTHVMQRTLTKSHAVWMYLGDLAGRTGLSKDRSPWRPANWHRSSDGERYTYTMGGTIDVGSHRLGVVASGQIAALDSRERRHERSRAWQAMLVQDVTLADGVHVLLIDTSDYRWTPPTSFMQVRRIFDQYRNSCRTARAGMTLPGRCGEVGPHQIAEIENMMATWPPGTRFFVMGHHPASHLRSDSAALLLPIFNRPGFMAYVSAHTHAPSTTHGHEADDVWELSVGSTTDWPMELARLTYWPDDAAPGTAVRLDVAYVESSATCPYARADQAHAEVDYGSTGRYVARALENFRVLLSTSMRGHPDLIPAGRAWLAKIATAPSRSDDYQRNLLAGLIAFDRTVLQQVPDIRRIELACAIWASAVECAKDRCSGRARGVGGLETRTLELRIPPSRIGGTVQ